MFALELWETAQPAWIAHENADGTFSMERESSHSYDDVSYWLTRAYGSRHTNPDDACDPIITTRIVQLTDDGWLRGIEWNLEQGRQTGRDAGDDPVLTIEEHWRLFFQELFTPDRCHCSHDCCGCRSGWSSVSHLGGTVFAVQISTSRNY